MSKLKRKLPESDDSENSLNYSSEDDFQPVPKLYGSVQNDIQKPEKTSIPSDSSDDEPVPVKSKITSKQGKSNMKSISNASESEGKSASSDEEESIIEIVKVTKMKEKPEKEENKRNLRPKIVKVIYTVSSEEDASDIGWKTKKYKTTSEEDWSDVDTTEKEYKRSKKRAGKRTYEKYSSDSSTEESSSDGENNITRTTEESSSDGEKKIARTAGRKKCARTAGRKKCARTAGQMSEYEKLVERNRAERMAFLQSLNIEEAKSGFVNAVHAITKKRCQPKKKRQRKDYSSLGCRKSHRLHNVNIDMSESGLYCKIISEAQKIEKKKGIPIPKDMPFKKTIKYDAYESYAEDVNIQESKQEYYNFVSYDKSMFAKLTLEEKNISQVTRFSSAEKISALNWYPSPEYLVVAAGGKEGNIYIWNVDNDSRPYVFKPHIDIISKLQFNPFNHVQMFTSSFDGSLRCGDMVKHVFNDIYTVSDETFCTYFDFIAENTFLVAQKNGQVALVDKQIKERYSHVKFSCHENAIKMVNVHPVNKNYFLTAGAEGIIRLWDLRIISPDPVSEITLHKKSVHSAFFSPVTGKSILSTSADGTVAMFDSTDLSNTKLKRRMNTLYDSIPLPSELQSHRRIKCCKKVKTMVAVQATWLPNSDEAFFIPSLHKPRRIQVFDTNMKVYHTVMHNNLYLTFYNVFHPFRPAIVSANPSGRVFIFK